MSAGGLLSELLPAVCIYNFGRMGGIDRGSKKHMWVAC